MADRMEQGKTGFTSVDGMEPHAHGYSIDEYGNGHTSGLIGLTVPHTHTVVNKKMHPSGADNHVHRLERGKPGQILEE